MKEKNKKHQIASTIAHWVRDNKTEWKRLENKGLESAEKLGDCIFLNLENQAVKLDAINDLKSRLYEVLGLE